MPIMVRPGFASADECAGLVDAIRTVKTLDPTARITELRTEMSAVSLREHGHHSIEGLRSRVLAELGRLFAIDGLWLECTFVTEMHAGDHVPLHADNETRADEGWKPNHTPFRTHAAILYLNSSGPDYTGGTLRFPIRGVEVIPASGTLVAFPCGRDFEHQVGAVSGGSRYTLAIWCTTYPDHEEPWP
jgi:hypothetical protein